MRARHAVPLQANPNPSVCFLIGPEGGFSDSEVALFVKLPNAVRLKFSSFMLRAETAAILITGLTALILDKQS